MLSSECLRELRASWLPNMTESGLDRLIEMLERGSPLLVHGCFTRAIPMGCLATHVAWNHPRTAHLTVDAGITWLHRVAGLNPATSAVIREWDSRGADNKSAPGENTESFFPTTPRPSATILPNWELRADFLAALKEYRAVRQQTSVSPGRELVEVQS